jgi:hypothetical protein
VAGGGASGERVAVSSTESGERSSCSPVRIRGPKRIAGGCVVEVSGSYVEFDVKTMVGDMDFSRCVMSFTMHVGGSGGVVVDEGKIDGRSPCNDVYPCFTDEAILPWRGKIRRVRGDRLELHVDMCLDTCLGRFRGPFVAGLRPTRKGWRIVADHAPVGMSGWEFHGDLDMSAKTLEFAVPSG